MKVTVTQILGSVMGLKKLVNEPLPAKTAYRIKRIMDAVTSETNRVEGIRNDLVKKYADEQTEEQKTKGENIRVKTNIKEFQAEFAPLLDGEVELNTVKIAFKDIENVKLTVQDLVALEPWIDIPAELAEPILKAKVEAPVVEEPLKAEAPVVEPPKVETPA